MKYLMGSSGPIADETLGSQVHFPWLPFFSGFGRRLHWAHLETRVKKLGLETRDGKSLCEMGFHTSAHPSPCCCCSIITASSELPSPVT